MMQVTIFGGHEGRLRYDKSFYLTLFGAAELVRPTVARELLIRRQARQHVNESIRKPFFFTMFGAVEIKAPTLAEEFVDLLELIRGGGLNPGDWERAMAEMARTDGNIGSFTMFAGFSECELPSEEQEIDSLALQSHLGNIAESARQVLLTGIGQRDAERRAILHRAMQATG